jgi:hypothetical protein
MDHCEPLEKDRELVAWAEGTGRPVYIGRNYCGWREAGWGNPFRPQTHAPEEHDRVIALYTRHLDDNPILLERLPELCGGKVLLCWCHPLPCHGDVLASLTFATGGGFRLFSTADDPRRLINTGEWSQKCV